MKIKNLRRAVGLYQHLNAGGNLNPHYGYLMFDTANGKMWTDEFCSVGHTNWVEYESDTIINLGELLRCENIPINMKNVRDYIMAHFTEF